MAKPQPRRSRRQSNINSETSRAGVPKAPSGEPE
jgi:hypothetical protein